MADSSLRQRRQPLDTKENAQQPAFSRNDIKKITQLQKQHELNEKNGHTILFLAITALSTFVSFFKIWYPAEVVFDEVHFGKFLGYYLRRTYFFDVHPPLGKLLLAAVGYLIGYDGHYEFNDIGESYEANHVPYVALRTFPAALNVLSVSLVYSIMKQSGYAKSICFLTAALVCFDNALVAQNRLIMLDSVMIFFILITVYSYIRFRKLRYQEFSTSWWLWLFATGAGLGCTLSIKMVGLFVVTAIGISVLVDLWALLDIQRGLTMNHFTRHFYARAVALIVVPAMIYLTCFYIHFAILIESGPGDSFMSSQFKDTLKNSATRMKALDIHYYDNITLSHRDTDVYLHSHSLVYPLRYEDGRISSNGKQVVGIEEPDINSWWQVLPATENEKADDDWASRTIRHDDVIRLKHIGTDWILLTHDVASPILSTNEEFTTVAPGERFNETLFKVVLEDPNNMNTWQTGMTAFKLFHMDTKVALWTHEQHLPEWGLGLQDVNGNKNLNERSNFWVAQEIQGKNATEINLSVKQTVKTMPFLRKYLELQGRIFSHNAGLTKPHPYQSAPISWPVMLRGISYWSKDETREQIYMTGNVVGWYLGLASVAIYSGVFLADLISRHRGIEPIDGPVRQRFVNNGGFFFMLYLLHYLPFFVMGRVLFLHHYLPAAVCSYMLLGAVLQFMFVDGITSPISNLQRNASAKIHRHTSVLDPMTAAPDRTSKIMLAIVLSCQVAMFLFLAPMTYGSPSMTVDQVLQHKIFSGWDLQFAK
ncbi:family 39 glycosyltransferase [Hesseltinella vesiculosa]|uniref:Dolichyl-phosphate-mannose--protein mannosyltransferase n=1 Tax=Hesseltinella vesiculosa TaxID=101127 RepID=A0A1X2GJK3_9FUNG|nr:family 39 glycosyltransferase [Hesseltinella vesiculosa]